MARNIPKSLATFVSGDSDTARMYSHVQAAVQPLLDFNAKWFNTTATGSLNILGNVAAKGVALLTSFRQVPDGTKTAPGLAWLTNGATGMWHTGGSTASEAWNFVVQGVNAISLTTAGTIFQATAGGSIAFFNNAAGALVGSINNLGTVNFPSFVSGQGFKCGYYMGQVTTSSQAANSTVQTFETTNIVAGSSAGARFSSYTMPFAGSVTSLTIDCSTTPVAQTIQLNKNGAVFTGASVVLPGSTAKVSAAFAKGAMPFATGDNLFATVTYAAAVSAGVSTFVRITVEFGA